MCLHSFLWCEVIENFTLHKHEQLITFILRRREDPVLCSPCVIMILSRLCQYSSTIIIAVGAADDDDILDLKWDVSTHPRTLFSRPWFTSFQITVVWKSFASCLRTAFLGSYFNGTFIVYSADYFWQKFSKTCAYSTKTFGVLVEIVWGTNRVLDLHGRNNKAYVTLDKHAHVCPCLYITLYTPPFSIHCTV